MKVNNMKVSLATTVLNDLSGIETFFECMQRQTRQPDEFVIVDGGSTDGTWERLKKKSAESIGGIPLVLHREAGCNVAEGRNLAIEKSAHSIIVSTDIGCDWDPEWLEELIAPFESEDNNRIDIVIGSWAVKEEDCKSDWAKVEFARRWPFKLEATPDSLGINRSIAYRKSIWEAVGGYPEDLTLAADDVVFDQIIRHPKWGFRLAAAPHVRCYWERHKSLGQFCREEKRNFFGAGEAGIWKKHFFLVGGRLGIEFILILSTLVLLLMPGPHLYAAIPAFIFVLSFMARMRALWPASLHLKQMGVKWRWLRLLIFEYLTKMNGMWGYLKGWLQGCRRCRKTRKRLASIG